MRHEHEQLTLNDCGPFFVSQQLKERMRKRARISEEIKREHACSFDFGAPIKETHNRDMKRS